MADTLQQINTNLPTTSTLLTTTLPLPTLTLDFRICVQLNPLIPVGKGPWGQRNWISFKSGHWSATWGHGIVLPGGQDSQLVDEDSLSTRVDTRYLLETSDEVPAFIVVTTQGWRTGPKEVLRKLFDPDMAGSVSPSEYSFRICVSLETGDERYKHLNTGMWIGSGARHGSEGE